MLSGPLVEETSTTVLTDAIRTCLTQTSNEVGDMVDIQKHLAIGELVQRFDIPQVKVYNAVS
jgi:hypothetical protein